MSKVIDLVDDLKRAIRERDKNPERNSDVAELKLQIIDQIIDEELD